MMFRLFVGLFVLAGFLGAQAPQEVVLSASTSLKLGVAVPAAQVQGLDAGLVARELHGTLLRDLEEAGPFSLVRDAHPRSTEPPAYKAWAEIGADWLLLLKAARLQGEELEVVAQVIDVKSGKPGFNRRYHGQDRVLRRIAHTLADDLMARLTGERGVADTRIVFVRDLGGGIKEIFQVDRDGLGLTQLTFHRSLTLSPTLAPDGRLAYITFKAGGPEIWGQLKPGAAHVRLYPGSGTRNIGHLSAPAWSPDGRRLAFVQGDRRGNSDIMVLDVSSGRARRLTDSNCINTEPSWNPAGTQLAFTSDREGSPQVYLMEEDGSNVRRLTREGGYNATPAWSPTGAMVAYVSRFEGKFDLFVYNLKDGKSYQVTTGLASSESPDWAPDERRIVFTSGSRGGMQLFTTDLSGQTLRRLTDFTGAQSPRWGRSR